jgi:hypothetical protein
MTAATMPKHPRKTPDGAAGNLEVVERAEREVPFLRADGQKPTP